MKTDDMIAFYRARLDEIDPNDFHDRYQCDLGQLQFFGDCSCKVPERTRRRVEAGRGLIEWCLDEKLRDAGHLDALELAVYEWADHEGYQESWKP